MKRSKLLELQNEHWVGVVDGDPLEIAIRPGASPVLGPLLNDPMNEQAAREVCRRLFLNFRGYTEEDGTVIQNTIDNRVELILYWPPMRAALLYECNRFQTEAAEGEANADSD